MPPKSRSPLQLNFPTRKTCLLCQIHRPSILPQPLLHHPNPPPTFSTSNPRLGRAGHKNDSSKGKQTSNTPSSPYSSSSKGVSTQPAGGESPPSDVLDFSRLDAAHENLVTQLRTDLVKLKPGGLDLDTVEAVRVSFKPVRQKFERRDDRILEWGKEREREKERVKNEVIRVRDLAQVFVRGRVCVVMVGEKEVCSFLFCFILLLIFLFHRSRRQFSHLAGKSYAYHFILIHVFFPFPLNLLSLPPFPLKIQIFPPLLFSSFLSSPPPQKKRSLTNHPPARGNPPSSMSNRSSPPCNPPSPSPLHQPSNPTTH